MGRPPVKSRPMTGAERQARRRRKIRGEPPKLAIGVGDSVSFQLPPETEKQWVIGSPRPISYDIRKSPRQAEKDAKVTEDEFSKLARNLRKERKRDEKRAVELTERLVKTLVELIPLQQQLELVTPWTMGLLTQEFVLLALLESKRADLGDWKGKG